MAQTTAFSWILIRLSHCKAPFHYHLLPHTAFLIIHMFMCTLPPFSLQSLSLDLLHKMSKSLAQNRTMVKLILTDGLFSITKVQDAKLFIRHLFLGLSGNSTLTDLTLDLPPHCWDWPQGELNVLHCLK